MFRSKSLYYSIAISMMQNDCNILSVHIRACLHVCCLQFAWFGHRFWHDKWFIACKSVRNFYGDQCIDLRGINCGKEKKACVHFGLHFNARPKTYMIVAILQRWHWFDVDCVLCECVFNLRRIVSHGNVWLKLWWILELDVRLVNCILISFVVSLSLFSSSLSLCCGFLMELRTRKR